MIVFENGIDIRCREVTKPQIAKFRVKDNEYRFVVIGTQYGHIHTSAGDVRTWGSYSSAYKFLKQYNPL